MRAFQRKVNLFPFALLWKALQQRHAPQRFPHGEIWIHAELLRQIAKRLFYGCGPFPVQGFAPVNFATVAAQYGCKDAQQRGLACAVRAQQAMDTWVDFHIDAI